MCRGVCGCDRGLVVVFINGLAPGRRLCCWLVEQFFSKLGGSTKEEPIQILDGVFSFNFFNLLTLCLA